MDTSISKPVYWWFENEKEMLAGSWNGVNERKIPKYKYGLGKGASGKEQLSVQVCGERDIRMIERNMGREAHA